MLRSRELEVELMNYLRNIIRNNSIFRNIIRGKSGKGREQKPSKISEYFVLLGQTSESKQLSQNLAELR